MLNNELGDFDESATDQPGVLDSNTLKRREEAKKAALEHKKNLSRMKKGVKGKAKARPGGFDRSKLKANFMANAKSSKDNVSGWAFDFDNPIVEKN